MSISVDTQQLVRLAHLETTLELLKNPETYTALLADVKNTLRQFNEASKKFATKESADTFLQEAQGLLASAKKEAAQIKAASAVTRAQEEAQFAATQAALDTELTAARQEQTKLVKMREDAVALKAELDQRQASVVQREAVLADAQAAFREEVTTLAAQKAAFNAKLAALAV
tara:strand:- start:755 stop:1270 length:516 start_codon:yes stop_codon:yes gene_type:complete